MNLKHAGSYYNVTPQPFPDVLTWFAQHYEQSCMPSPANAAAAKAANPNHHPYTYHSLYDIYSALQEGIDYAAIAVELGVDPEACYLHYGEDTEIEWYGGERTITPAGGRVEVYFAGHQNASIRHAASFLEAVRPVHVEFLRRFMAAPEQVNHDGLMLDNAAPSFWNWGTKIISGGTVAEAGIKVNMLSAWHWSQLRPTLALIKAALTPKGVAINIASSWSDDLLKAPWVCTDIIQESVGNPARDFWPAVAAIRDRHRRSHGFGVRIWTSGNTYLGDPALGQIPWDDMLHGHLCYALVVGSPSSFWHVQDWTGPRYADWPDKIWPKATGAAQALGGPMGEPILWEQGVTARGTSYEVWRQNYAAGYVLLRLKNPHDGSALDDSVHPMPDDHNLLGPDGLVVHPDTFRIHNGGGAILIRT